MDNNQQMQEPVEIPPQWEVRNWFENKREGSQLLRLSVTNKTTGKVKVRVQI